MLDPASQFYYYYNQYTGEQQWEVPDGYEEQYAAAGGTAGMHSPLLTATLKIQGLFHRKMARRAMRVQRARRQAADDYSGGGDGARASAWVETLDPDSGCYY